MAKKEFDLTHKQMKTLVRTVLKDDDNFERMQKNTSKWLKEWRDKQE